MDFYAHRIFAAVVNGVVENVFICEDPSTANWIVQQSYGISENIFAVDVTRIPVMHHDIYVFEENTFYRVDEETGTRTLIDTIPTPEGQIETLNSTINVLVDSSMDTEYKIAEIELAVS